MSKQYSLFAIPFLEMKLCSNNCKREYVLGRYALLRISFFVRCFTMGTKTKAAIVLFVLQIISTMGLLLANNGGNYLGAIGSAIGLSSFTIIGIILICLDNRVKSEPQEQKKIGFSVSDEAQKSDEDEDSESDDDNSDDWFSEDHIPTSVGIGILCIAGVAFLMGIILMLINWII